MFVVPSLIIGYISSVPALAFIYKYLLKDDVSIEIKSVPTATATIQAILLGLLIPLVSSVLPIR